LAFPSSFGQGQDANGDQRAGRDFRHQKAGSAS
jgi:hypothetical protein